MGISGMKNYPHLQLQLKNQSYVPMAPVPDFSCCVGFINLEIGNRRNSGILIHNVLFTLNRTTHSSKTLLCVVRINVNKMLFETVSNIKLDIAVIC